MPNIDKENKMSGLNVGEFEHNGVGYIQLLYVNEDDRVEVFDQNGDLILTFTADCYIKKDNKYIGKLIQDRNGFIYFTFDLSRGYHESFETKVNARGIDAYFKAEAVATKYFLDNKTSILMGK